MVKASRTIGWIALHILLLAGPVLGFATKGFAPLLVISGSLAFIAGLLQPEKLKQLGLQQFTFAIPFLIFMGFSVFWSSAENAGFSYFTLILVVIFTTCLLVAFKELAPSQQDKYRHLLSASLLFGIIASLIIGSYPLFWPELSILAWEISNQATFANIELIRQSNRSLSLIPIFLFPLAGFYWRRARWLFIPLIPITLYLTANSNSQTAFLAMLLGLIVAVFSYFYKYNGKKLIFIVTAAGLLISPAIFLKSFEHNLVQKYAPQIVKQKASGKYREWIYYTYANEALSRPLAGHGIRSSKNFSPVNLDNYIKLAEEQRMIAVDQAKLAHAHNFPLQIIFEFGYLGAILFLAAFWCLLNVRFIRLGSTARAATLAAICGLLLFAYSLWQSWLLCSLGLLYFYVGILYRHENQKIPEFSDEVVL